MCCLGLSTPGAADIHGKEHLGRKYDMEETFPCQKEETPPTSQSHLGLIRGVKEGEQTTQWQKLYLLESHVHRPVVF